MTALEEVMAAEKTAADSIRTAETEAAEAVSKAQADKKQQLADEKKKLDTETISVLDNFKKALDVETAKAETASMEVITLARTMFEQKKQSIVSVIKQNFK